MERELLKELRDEVAIHRHFNSGPCRLCDMVAKADAALAQPVALPEPSGETICAQLRGMRARWIKLIRLAGFGDQLDGDIGLIDETIQTMQWLRQQVALRARCESVALDANHVIVPKEPPKGLLVSIALRFDHGLFMRNSLFDETEEQHANRIALGLADASRAYEEITGKGFWSPERNAAYEAMIAAIEAGKE